MRAVEQKIVVTVACGSVEEARTMARLLVGQRLAACVQVVPQVESVYRWKGQVETATEALLVIKTVGAKWDALVAAVRAEHSYEVPEILAMPISDGLVAYLQWMDTELEVNSEA